jgi:hypothetical protein
LDWAAVPRVAALVAVLLDAVAIFELQCVTSVGKQGDENDDRDRHPEKQKQK